MIVSKQDYEHVHRKRSKGSWNFSQLSGLTPESLAFTLFSGVNLFHLSCNVHLAPIPLLGTLHKSRLVIFDMHRIDVPDLSFQTESSSSPIVCGYHRRYRL